MTKYVKSLTIIVFLITKGPLCSLYDTLSSENQVPAEEIKCIVKEHFASLDQPIINCLCHIERKFLQILIKRK